MLVALCPFLWYTLICIDLDFAGPVSSDPFRRYTLFEISAYPLVRGITSHSQLSCNKLSENWRNWDYTPSAACQKELRLSFYFETEIQKNNNCGSLIVEEDLVGLNIIFNHQQEKKHSFLQ